jgi:hypothetical protein
MSGFRDTSEAPPPVPSRRASRWTAVMALMLGGIVLSVAAGCRRADEPIVSEFTDTFDRADLGPAWRDTGGNYRIEKGELIARQVRHHPLWLRRVLPPNAAIEFDAWTNTPNADIRVVLYGDGKSTTAAGEGCQSSGYALVFGGWGNKLSVICRDQQAGHVRVRTDWPLVPGRQYHFYITRQKGLLSWFLAGHELMTWDDPAPLGGPGHTAFGFDGAEGDVTFDNLTIAPLKD